MHTESGSCCSDGDCRVPRRDFLKVAGVASLATLVGPLRAFAGPFSRPHSGISHFVPAEKQLDPGWVKSLYERGVPHAWRGAELNQIGMPIGGIAAGQLYLCGDGTLGDWKIFRETYETGYGRENYRPAMPERTVEQGFAVIAEPDSAENPNSKLQNPKSLWSLDRQTFPAVEFNGQFPLGRVRYRDAACPVSIEMEAFSPFIPLHARDSATPGTLFRITVRNESAATQRVSIAGWLANAICHHSAREFALDGNRRTQRQDAVGRSMIVHSTAGLPPDPSRDRPDLVIADFEGDNYGDWKVEGAAFGAKPARGAVSWQTEIRWIQGRGLVNSFAGSDEPHGTLTSPEFKIERRSIQFLIGGGNRPGETCVNLIIDGRIARTATGRNREQLQWHAWEVSELEGRLATIQIVDRHSGGWGHINVDQIVQTDRKRYGDSASVAELADFGTMALAFAGDGLSPAQSLAKLQQLNADLSECVAAADESYAFGVSKSGVLITRPITLPPQAEHTFEFALAWHFPNRSHGAMYANWYADAAAVAAHLLRERQRLNRETKLWHDTFYDSTLPYWLLDRIGSTLSYLATGTCTWRKNGRFWAWEGVGCCAGTCTHVWNYAHGMARLFPDLERSVREMQDLGGGFRADGLVGMRSEDHQHYAADGQCGTILKCYREHLCSADDGFLQRCWPRIKAALEFVIREDRDADGLLEGRQHNTYDIDFHGPNTFVGALYLAALRAGEEMALEMGDGGFATGCRALFESGSRKSIECLWNGEYFFQEVDLQQHPRDQYGDGCLSDQLFGQGWAHQLGLGYLYPAGHVRTALQSIWKYNWAPDIGPHNAMHKPERWFVSPGEAGMYVCTWPRSAYLKDGVRYREEVWTGCEYQVAGHMIWEGMVEKGLAMIRAIHDRYHPARHNPYNEVECGDHYARALASWGAYNALLGFEYHGPRGHVGFGPRLSPENFRAAFTAADGWGTFEQHRANQRTQVNRLRMTWGTLRLKSLSVWLPDGFNSGNVSVRLRDQSVAASVAWNANRVILKWDDEISLNAGDALEVVIAAV